MFEHKSRYNTLEDASHTTADGRVLTYKRRRFLPDGKNMPLLVEVTVTQGDRLDLITARTLGDPEQFWRICDANNTMDPSDLIETGRILRIPVPQF
jgi:nucleoid-associated protein YgaU